MKTNVYVTNHRKKKSEISPNDFYSTHSDSINTFLEEFLKKYIIYEVWEPAAGRGNISSVLQKFGIKVFSSDLISRGENGLAFERDGHTIFGNIDFLQQKSLPNNDIDTIITNPPFSLAEEFIRKSIELHPKLFIIMYLKLTFLEGKKRYKLFQEYPPTEVWIHSSRQNCDKNGAEEFKNGSAVAYAWFVWKMNTIRPAHPELYWLPPNS